MSEHSWCRNISRDEAVRAAEDNRPGPLPTLEEAIAEPFADSQGKCESMIPKTVSASSAVEPESKGDSMRPPTTKTATVENDLAAVTERRPPEPGGGGNVTALRMERDAAIRERDKLRAERITQALTADRFAAAVQEADRLRARVAELESSANADGGSNHAPQAASGAAVLAEIAAAFGCHPDDDADLVEAARLLVKERDTAVAKAASGAAEAEPVAWGIANPGNPIFGNQKVFTVRATEKIAKEVYRSCNGWVHFPLYTAPQPSPPLA